MTVPPSEMMRHITRRPGNRVLEKQQVYIGTSVQIPIWWRHTDPIGNNAYVAISSTVQKLRP